MRCFLGALIPLFPTSVRSLEVIGAGFGRTGTSSLREALNLLGYKTYHMKEAMKNGHTHLDAWTAYFRGEKKELADIVKTVYEDNGYTAAVDFPTCSVWPELAKVYPHAKIVLTERSSPERWWESASQTILIPTTLTYVLFAVAPFWRTFAELLDWMWFQTFDIDRPRQLSPDDRDKAIDAYKRNSQEARAFEDDERVLVYHVSQGWGPLCEFLGKEVPPDDVPFPNINRLEDFKSNMLKQGLFFLLPSLLILAFVSRWMRGKSPNNKNHVSQKKED